MSRIRRVTLAAAVLTVAAVTGCGGSSQGSGAQDAVSYGGQTIVPDLVFRGKDWAKPYGIDIDQVRFPSGSEAFQALLSGEVNVSNGGSGRLITIAAQRPDAITIVAKWQYGGSRYSVLTPPGSSIDAASDLEGKTVAVDTGSGAYTLFQEWLRDNDVDPDDVTIAETEVTDVGAALQSKSADVGVAWEPTASLLVHKKVAERMTTLESAGESPNFLIVNKSWADDHRDEVVNFLKAALDVGQFIEKDPDAAGRLAAETSSKEGVDTPAVALADSLRHIKMAPEIDQASLDELSDLAEDLVEQQTIPDVPDFKAMVDNSYLEEAMSQ